MDCNSILKLKKCYIPITDIKMMINNKNSVLADKSKISSSKFLTVVDSRGSLENIPLDSLAYGRSRKILTESESSDDSEDEDWVIKKRKPAKKKIMKQKILTESESSVDSEILTESESSDDSEILTESESSDDSEDEEWVIKKRKPAERKIDKYSMKQKIRKKEKIMEEEKDSFDDEDEDQKISSYEKMIESRRAEKFAILQSLGINKVKAEFSQTVSSLRKPERVKRVPLKKKPVENLPVRKSRRLANIDCVDYSEEAFKYRVKKLLTPEQAYKKIPPEISYKDALKSDSGEEFMKDLSVQQSKVKSEFFSYDRSVFQRMSLSPSSIAKIVPSRVSASSWYPSIEKLILASGDKDGHIGLWNVDKDSVPHVFEPHTRKISNLEFNPFSFEHLVSSSYDGTVRCCDLVKQMFNQVYDISDKSMCTYLDILSSTSYLVSQMNGEVALIDTRTSRKHAEKRHKCHEHFVKTVNIHPVNRNVFVTVSCKNPVSVWDLRKLQAEPVFEIRHQKRRLNCAFFSPVTGNSILTTASMDYPICIFDSTNLLQEAKLRASLKPDDCTLNWWLQTFRANWLPNSDETFIVQSMNVNGQLQIFDKDMKNYYTMMDENLTITPVNVLHPFRPALAANNNNGNVFVFT